MGSMTACNPVEVISHFDFCALPVLYEDEHINDTYDWQLTAPRFFLRCIGKYLQKPEIECCKAAIGCRTLPQKALHRFGAGFFFTKPEKHKSFL